MSVRKRNHCCHPHSPATGRRIHDDLPDFALVVNPHHVRLRVVLELGIRFAAEQYFEAIREMTMRVTWDISPEIGIQTVAAGIPRIQLGIRPDTPGAGIGIDVFHRGVNVKNGRSILQRDHAAELDTAAGILLTG